MEEEEEEKVSGNRVRQTDGQVGRRDSACEKHIRDVTGGGGGAAVGAHLPHNIARFLIEPKIKLKMFAQN